MIHFIKQNSCVLAFFKKDLNCSPLHLGGGGEGGGDPKILTRYLGGDPKKKMEVFKFSPIPPLINNECSLTLDMSLKRRSA